MEDEGLVPAEAAEEVQAETPAEVTEGEEGEQPITPVEQQEEGEFAPPRKKTAQERIDEITRARRNAEREKEYWRKIALEKQTPIAEPPKPQVSPIPERPRIDQFDTTEEYEDALIGWHDKKKEVETWVATKQREEKEMVAKFQKSAATLRAEHDDFDEVIEAPVFSPAMRLTLFHSENGAELAYYLGKPENRAIADKIRSLPSAELQTYEIGKLETKLVLAKGTKKVSGAPPPITPVGMSGGTTVDESKLDDKAWFERRKLKKIEELKRKSGG